MTNSIFEYHSWHLSSSLYKTGLQNYYFLLYYINIKLSTNIDIKIVRRKVFHLVYIKPTFRGFATTALFVKANLCIHVATLPTINNIFPLLTTTNIYTTQKKWISVQVQQLINKHYDEYHF
jgi:hypothetical protein